MGINLLSEKLFEIYRRPLMAHPGGWGWRRLMNYFLFSSPARKGGVVDSIRPPTENYSLTFRLTRNCYWNKCGFYPAYKFGASFSKRSIEEVKEDIRRAKLIDDLLIVHRFPHWQTLSHAMSKWVTLSPYIVDRHNLN